MKKYLYWVACAVCVILAWLALTAEPSDAHTPTVEARCGTLTVNLRAYDEFTSVVVRINGTAVVRENFSGDWQRTLQAPTTSYRWSLAVDNVESFWDVDTSGDVTCTPASTTSTSTSTTTTAAPVTTTTVARLDPPLIERTPALPLRSSQQQLSVPDERVVLAFTGFERGQIIVVGVTLLSVGLLILLYLDAYRKDR